MPPAVALSNYISGGILWRIFAKLEFSRGFHSIYIITNAVWISEAAMEGVGDNILIKKEKNKNR